MSNVTATSIEEARLLLNEAAKTYAQCFQHLVDALVANETLVSKDAYCDRALHLAAVVSHAADLLIEETASAASVGDS